MLYVIMGVFILNVLIFYSGIVGVVVLFILFDIFVIGFFYGK